MTSYRIKALVTITAAAALLILTAVISIPGRANADIYNPHPIPPSNSITTAMIKDGQITSAKLANGAEFTLTGATPYDISVCKLNVSSGLTAPASTTFNGVHYSFPSSAGSSGDTLTIGSGNALSWGAPSNTQLIQEINALNAVATGTALTITGDNIRPDANGSDYFTSNGSTRSITFTTSHANEAVLIYDFTFNNSSRKDPTSICLDTFCSMPNLGIINGGNIFGRTYYAIATSTGSHTLSYSFSGTATVGVLVQTYYGNIPNINFIDSHTNTTGSGTSFSCSNTSTKDWGRITSGIATNGTTLAAGSNTTLQLLNSNTKFGSFDDAGISAIHPAGSRTLNYTSTNAGYAGICLTIIPNGSVGVEEASAANQDSANAFIGFSEGSYATDTTAKVITDGVVKNITGISVGGLYYLSNTKGAISTTAGTNSRKVALGVSSTSVEVTNIW